MKALLAALVLLCACFSTSFSSPDPAPERLVIYTVLGDDCDCTATYTRALFVSAERCPCQQAEICGLPSCVLTPYLACCKIDEDYCATVDVISTDAHDGKCDCTTGGTIIGQKCCIDLFAEVCREPCCEGQSPCNLLPNCCAGSSEYEVGPMFMCDDTPVPAISGYCVDVEFGTHYGCDPDVQTSDADFATIWCDEIEDCRKRVGYIKTEGTCICALDPN